MQESKKKQGLKEGLEAGKEYLLSEEDFLLSPNYIFATLPRMELELCYLPGYGVPLREQLVPICAEKCLENWD